MTSPAKIPAESAAVPQITPSTSAPDLAGAIFAGVAVASPGRQSRPLLITLPVCRFSWLACCRGSVLLAVRNEDA